MTLISLCVLAIGLYALLFTLFNIRFMHAVNKKAEKAAIPPEGDRPTVSVCIPARDEEAVIGRSVRSFLDQEWKPDEILVLDDNSSDRTAEIVKDIAKDHPEVKLLHGGPLPQGWRGKINAEAQLAKAAKGDWILFTDADTRHSPLSISMGMKKAMTMKADMVSGFPRQECRTIVGCCISVMTFVTMLWIPLWLQKRIRLPFFASAIGQYMLVRRKALEEAGGFAMLKSSVCDDMDLSKLLTKRKRYVLFCDMKHEVSCTMYQSLQESLYGIERSIFGVLTGGALMYILLAPAVVALSLVTLSPLIALAALLIEVNQASVMLSIGTFGFWTAFFLNTKWHGYKLPVPLLGPVTFALLMVMFWQETFQRASKKSYQWKGRSLN